MKLADFGWSRQKETERTTFCGTPDYLSPEMINGTEQTEKLDIWTMGILMFELLHGKAPFSLNKKFSPRNKLQEIQRDILKGEITFSRNISLEAQEIIKAMMDPDPLMRPTAYELLTFPFFTSRYPFLASLNVKNSFFNSKYFNKSKVTNPDYDSALTHMSNNKSQMTQKQNELKEREEKIKKRETEFEKEKSDFYKRVIEFDKIKDEFRTREIAKNSEMNGFRKEQEDFYNQVLEWKEEKKKVKQKELVMREREILLEEQVKDLEKREQDLEDQLVNSMAHEDKE